MKCVCKVRNDQNARFGICQICLGLEENRPVEVGEEVKIGQIIAYGRRGNLHLSVVLRIGGFINPLYVYLDSFDPFTTDAKSVDIPYTDGTEIFPKDAKQIWPIACKKSS